MPQPVSVQMIHSRLGQATNAAIATVNLDAALAGPDDDHIDAAGFAAALCIVLHHELLDRVPTGAAFVGEQLAAGERIRFDHGALRTVRFPVGPTGELPGGADAFARILVPLGYAHVGTYPLPRLRMTGGAYMHRDHMLGLPQFFISELHVEALDQAALSSADTVFGASTDPLTRDATEVLARFGQGEHIVLADAIAAFPAIVAAFGRHHPIPFLSDYETLRAASAEAGWIATEGNAFNHGTILVDDVEAVAAAQRNAGRPIKDHVEVSASGRVRQTAFRADSVVRQFRDKGGLVERSVPGSFYEIISRAIDPETGSPDHRFDSGNATGIFAVTSTV